MTINGMAYCKTISNSIVNADIFTEYINELCAYLRDILHIQRACLILDNSRLQKRTEIERITSEFNFEYKFLSTFSYMLNPIGNEFSKIKNGVGSRLILGTNWFLSELIFSETNTITPTDSAGYFRNVLRTITNCNAEFPYIHK